MKKKDPKSVSGAVICGVIGISAIGLYLIFRKKDTALDEIGKMISHVGEILDNHHVSQPALIKDLGKTLHHNESTIGAVVDWISKGISLWEKFKN